jgi:hypothetical protein
LPHHTATHTTLTLGLLISSTVFRKNKIQLNRRISFHFEANTFGLLAIIFRILLSLLSLIKKAKAKKYKISNKTNSMNFNITNSEMNFSTTMETFFNTTTEPVKDPIMSEALAFLCLLGTAVFWGCNFVPVYSFFK